MAAYTQRRHEDAQILAYAYHEPGKLAELFPPPPKRPAGGRWWE